MATRYFCDRCERNYSDSEYITNLTINKPDESDAHGLNQLIRIDICGHCYRELQEWAKPLPRAAKG